MNIVGRLFSSLFRLQLHSAVCVPAHHRKSNSIRHLGFGCGSGPFHHDWISSFRYAQSWIRNESWMIKCVLCYVCSLIMRNEYRFRASLWTRRRWQWELNVFGACCALNFHEFWFYKKKTKTKTWRSKKTEADRFLPRRNVRCDCIQFCVLQWRDHCV